MPRGYYDRSKAKRRKDSLALAVQANVSSLIPEFNKIKGWDGLNNEEQKLVVTEGQQLAVALLQFGHSRIAIGEHLTKLRSILEPHNMFERFLKNFHFSKRTAYRYIAGFENAKAMLPENVVKVALSRGYAIIGDTQTKPLGIYTDAVAKLPPPTNPTVDQASTWLDQVEQVRKKARSEGTTSIVTSITSAVPQNPDVLLKECYRFINVRYKKLPINHKSRAAWVRSLVGMLLADLGVSGQQSFAPMAIPEEFRAHRGRPREEQAA